MSQVRSAEHSDLIHLSSGGVSVLLNLRAARLPVISYWGASLGPLTREAADALVAVNSMTVVDSGPDAASDVAILPEAHTGWTGRPGVSGSRDGAAWSPLFRVTSVNHESGDWEDVDPLVAGASSVHVVARDEISELSLDVVVELTEAGVLRSMATLRNEGELYRLEDISFAYPVPARAREILDFAGRWAKERTPQRGSLRVGAHVREGRRGRTGADAATLLSVGVPGFGFASGEVWGVHVGFSGNHRHYAERLATGEQVIGAGELLLPGEIELQQGDSYSTPWVYGLYGDGLDDQARRLHRHLRDRPSHPRSPRPVTLNVWEAVYFDHDLERLLSLADRAAELGVERFVLDDGWFRGRRDERAGLGDWYVDETVWPGGLHPLVARVRSHGMQFGLWFEPEMVSPDSDLARAHPEWVMQTGQRQPVPSRHQQVLNLGLPAAYDFVRDRMVEIIATQHVDYIKWDQNRDLIDAGTAPSGRPGVHEQTLAAYRLMAELKRTFPVLEIESCSSGGGRVDLGVLEYTDRVWASDCIDPHERQQINRWTQQLVPLELLGSHVASGRSHTTGRIHDLSFRAGTALFGHFGIEWDLTKASVSELAELADWVAFYKASRELLHTGEIVRMDEVDPALWVSGVISVDRTRALFAFAFMGRSDVASIGSTTLRELDPLKSYRLHHVRVGEARDHSDGWWGDQDGGTVMTGRALKQAGIRAPSSEPDRVWLLRVEAV